MGNGIEDVLRRAEAAVDAAGVAEDLRSVAFAKIVDHLLASSDVKPSAPQPHGALKNVPAASASTAHTDTTDALGKIAARLALDRQPVEDTFHVDDAGDVKLSLATSQLDSMDQKAQQEVALLVAAGRQAGRPEEWTHTKEIRVAVDDYGKMNHHFAESLSEMTDEFSFRGKGQSREVKLKKGGWEDAAALVTRLQSAG